MPEREPPYPANTNVSGTPFPLFAARVEQSNTWILTAPTPELRPWLLMVWYRSWLQIPGGSWPDDDAIIAAHIGMPMQTFKAQREAIMRGWYKATDGRLYHNVISELVLERIEQREQWRKRQGHARVTRESPDSHAVVTPVSRTAGAFAGVVAGAGAIPSNNGSSNMAVVDNSTRTKSLSEKDKRPNLPPQGWHQTDQGTDQAGKLLGIAPAAGETYYDYRRRLFVAIGERTRGKT